MDIVSNKTRECVGYTTFRNTLVEQRIKLLNLYELIRETTNLEKNETTGKVDHPRQTVKIVDGMTIKSVGKDEIDSLGGAVYNATLSVNLDELDYLDGVTIADSSMVLKTDKNNANQFFGITTNAQGTPSVIINDNLSEEPEVDVNSQIDLDIKKEIDNTKDILTKIKASNPDTKLSDKELLDMFGAFQDDGFIIF